MIEEEKYTKRDYAIMSVKIASKILDIPEDIAEVTFKGKEFFRENDVSGVFVKEGYWIVFNEEWVDKVNPFEIMVTGFHETRHAYQQLIIDHGPNVPCYNDVPIERIERWRYEDESLIMPEGKMEDDLSYLSQDREIDAVAFAYYLSDLLLHQKVKLVEGTN